MSHFVTFVLIPGNTSHPDVESAVAALLEPFDEEIEVAPYSTDCYCIEGIAAHAGTTAANDAVATISDLRTRYWALPEAERPTQETWFANWHAVKNRVEQAHPLYQKPNPDCEECAGSGQRMTTYNPDSQWDWWVIGGRWAGWLSRMNQLRTKNAARKNKIPFAVVTPDGAWHDKGKMGWWGMASDEKADEAWEKEVHDLLAAHPDTITVACDLHI